jgi:hypothetical protein
MVKYKLHFTNGSSKDISMAEVNLRDRVVEVTAFDEEGEELISYYPFDNLLYIDYVGEDEEPTEVTEPGQATLG